VSPTGCGGSARHHNPWYSFSVRCTRPSPLDADTGTTPPDSTPAAQAAAWLLDPAAPVTETANARHIRKWETEPEWTPAHDQL